MKKLKAPLLGGLSIAAGVAPLYLFNGWVGGMRSVFSSSWSFKSKRAFFQQACFVSTRNWRVVFGSVKVLAWAMAARQAMAFAGWALYNCPRCLRC